MVDSVTPISQLPVADTLGGDEDIPLVQEGVTKRTSASALSGLLQLAEATGAALMGWRQQLAYAVGTVGDAIAQLFQDADNCTKGIWATSSSIFILGDSITEGTGATTYLTSYAYGLARSIANARDYRFDADAGLGYQTTVKMDTAMLEPGMSTTGTIITTGVVQGRLSLAAGQSVVITQRAIVSADVIYDGSVSSGSLQTYFNGNLVATKAVSGTTLANTFQTLINGGALCTEADTVTLTAVGGTIVITGLMLFRTSGLSPTVYVAAKSGTAYQDYTGAAAVAEIAYYMNLFRTTDEKILVIALGTNNMYNPAKALSPTAMIAQATSLIAQINALVTGVAYVISVPPKANEATWPQQAGASYQDYVDAIVTFCRTNSYAMVRNDRAIYSRVSTFLIDGLHPNNQSHRIMGQRFAEALGIPWRPFINTAAPTGVVSDAMLSRAQADVVMAAPWRPYTNNNLFRAEAHRTGNIVNLSGIVEPNGATSAVVGTVPAGFTPDRTIYLTARSDSGAAYLNITSAGVVTLTAVPGAWFSFEGISYPMVRA